MLYCPVCRQQALTDSFLYQDISVRFIALCWNSSALNGNVLQVAVVITDVNDCAPEFQQTIYSKEGVPETVPPTSTLLQG